MNSTTNTPDAFPGHDGGLWQPVPCQVVASWPIGYFAENLAVDEQGTIFISLHLHHRIDRYDTATHQTTTFANITEPVTGMAFAADGTLWATGGTVFKTPGYIFRITKSGVVEEWVQIPDAVFLNGCAMHPDGQTLLVCESRTGRVLAVDQVERTWRVWISDERLIPMHDRAPGANGIKLWGNNVFISVTDRNILYRVGVCADGSAGSIEVAAEKLRADDFAFATSGKLYAATHPAHTVLRLDPDGTRVTIAGPDQGSVGSTACAFGRGEDDKTMLYVTTNGGLWEPYRGEAQEARLLRLDVGETGASLLSGATMHT